ASINALGEIEWGNVYSILKYPDTYYNPVAIHPANDTGFLISGTYLASKTGSFIAKVDSVGNMIWNKYYELDAVTLNPIVQFSEIFTLDNENYLVAGSAGGGRPLITKINESGVPIYTKHLGDFISDSVYLTIS